MPIFAPRRRAFLPMPPPLLVSVLPAALTSSACAPDVTDFPFEDDDYILIDLGEDSAKSYLSGGWGDPERVGDRSVQWSVAGTSEARVAGPFTDRLYLLSAFTAAVGGTSDQKIEIRINEVSVAHLEIPEGFHWWQVVLEPGMLRPSGNTLQFVYARVVRPVHRGGPGARDVRRLGVLWDQIRIEPIPEFAVVDAGTSLARRNMPTGWSANESSEDRTVVWSDGTVSTIELPVAPAERAYEIVLDAMGESLDVPVSLNDQVVGRASLAPRMQESRFPLARGFLARGLNRLEFRYPRMFQPAATDLSSSDRRALAMLLDWAAIVPLGAVARLDFGTAVGRPALRAGWSADEVVDARSAVWSDAPRSTLSLHCEPLNTPYELVIDARAVVRDVPHVVGVSVNGHHVGQLRYEDEAWHQQRLLVPFSRLRAGENSVELSYAYTVRPSAENPATADERALAVLVDRIVLRPRPP